MIRVRLYISSEMTGIDNSIIDFITQIFYAFCIVAQSHRPGAFWEKLPKSPNK